MICILLLYVVVNKEHTYIHCTTLSNPTWCSPFGVENSARNTSCLMVCNTNWHLLGHPKLLWHSDCLIKEGGCVDLSVDTMHL